MVGKESENGVKGFQFHKPDNRTKWEAFQKALYNPSTNEFLGRTAKSWVQILVFYTIFYICLAAFFAICMQGLLSTLDDREPKWQLDSSLIGTNPGLGFRPISERTEEGSLIWYDPRNATTTAKWSGLLDKFLESYNQSQTGANFVNCGFGKNPPDGKVCTVNLDEFGPCSPQNSYGYKSPSPCIFLKLNKIFSWVPEFYTEPEPKMSQDLKDYITALPKEERGQIWISCIGEGPVDKEHVREFGYYPYRGFPGFYFPYKNLDNYLSPLIAVQIINPKPNVIVSIECRSWAKNINYRGGDLQREGSVRFEVLVDAV